MITFKQDNIFNIDTEAIINTVNTVGVMGKGIALQFKEKYPENFKVYKKACDKNELSIGKILVFETQQIYNPKYIINFPTKEHWRNPSKMEYIKSGLEDLKRFIIDKKIKSIAIPPLGAGNGKLEWNKVKEVIYNELKDLKNIDIIILEPSESSYSNKKLENVKLTNARAMVLSLFQKYTVLGYELTLLEAQKLVYFLQRFGEDLKLDYSKNIYGPYAAKLNHVLYDLEGSYLEGMKYKDIKPMDKLYIKAEKFDEIENFIKENCSKEQLERLNKVSELIEEFESPLGMELLATVDFIVNEKKYTKTDNSLVEDIHSWSQRKKDLMKPEYIKIAYERLQLFKGILYSDIYPIKKITKKSKQSINHSKEELAELEA